MLSSNLKSNIRKIKIKQLLKTENYTFSCCGKKTILHHVNTLLVLFTIKLPGKFNLVKKNLRPLKLKKQPKFEKISLVLKVRLV
jgi:hypothetical protein